MVDGLWSCVQCLEDEHCGTACHCDEESYSCSCPDGCVPCTEDGGCAYELGIQVVCDPEVGCCYHPGGSCSDSEEWFCRPNTGSECILLAELNKLNSEFPPEFWLELGLLDGGNCGCNGPMEVPGCSIYGDCAPSPDCFGDMICVDLYASFPYADPDLPFKGICFDPVLF